MLIRNCAQVTEPGPLPATVLPGKCPEPAAAKTKAWQNAAGAIFSLWCHVAERIGHDCAARKPSRDDAPSRLIDVNLVTQIPRRSCLSCRMGCVGLIALGVCRTEWRNMRRGCVRCRIRGVESVSGPSSARIAVSPGAPRRRGWPDSAECGDHFLPGDLSLLAALGSPVGGGA